MKGILVILLLFTGFSLSAETAVEGLKEIRKLYETKNFDKLVRERYSEAHKFKGEEDYKKLIDFMTKRMGPEKNLKMALVIMDEALKVEPKIIKNPSPNEMEDEDMAIFPIKFHGKDVEYKIYQMKNGKWGFHL